MRIRKGYEGVVLSLAMLLAARALIAVWELLRGR